VAIVISCLGLFGLATYTAQVRIKEIGIRKVLGASVASITKMLSVDFIFLVIIAVGTALPVSGYFMDKWLGDFFYRTPMPWWIFGLSGTAAIAIALITVSFQCIRAALDNPVKSLKND
jgi:putative ABC transport system permease protein